MPRALCLLHANCQGDALRPLLEQTESFSRHYTIRQYVNYARQEIAVADIEKCALFLYQKLAPKWGELATESMLPRLPHSCITLEIPNLFFKGYWPFWTNKITGVDFADELLESLLSRGLPHAEILHLYEQGSPSLLGDVAATAEASLQREESKEKDAPIRCANILREFWQTEQLFITVNHPGHRLVFHIADSILRLLGLGMLTPALREAYVHPQDDFWLPIHPALGNLLSLPFAFAARRYKIYKSRLTHREYTACYLACRANQADSLLTFLYNLRKH